jgi:hypothetical protein
MHYYFVSVVNLMTFGLTYETNCKFSLSYTELKFTVYGVNTFRPHGVYILRGLSSHQSGAL